MEEINRPLYPDEIRLLNKLKRKIIKGRVPTLKLYHYLLILLTGVALADTAHQVNIPFVTFVFGTMAAICFLFVVFSPYEVYRKKNQLRKKLVQINNLLMENVLSVTLIHASEIALAEEYEDEGDLYLIEYEPGAILYYWDHDYYLRKRLPCLKFEIYNDDFAALTGRQVHALSEKATLRMIGAKLKWQYLGKYGAPAHLTTERVEFEELMNRF